MNCGSLVSKVKSFVIKNEEGGEREEFWKSVIYAFLAALLVRTFIYEPFHIPSGSMKPGLVEGDYILVSKFSYGYGRYTIPFGIPLIKNRILDFTKPQRGDVVVFRLPSNPRINYIKRLVGLPNDKIVIKNNMLYINGEEMAKEYIDEYTDLTNFSVSLRYLEDMGSKKISILQEKFKKGNGRGNNGEFIVPDGYYFFMGDNRDNSLDSRFDETGYVPYKNIVGKAKIIFFSKSDSIFKFWKWHKIIRFKRIFSFIK
jgi:signal peptidase I